MLWEYLREEEFDAAIERSGGICIIPIGCLEKHGEHLPVGTDSLVARKICEDAAEKNFAVVFPTGLWLGDVSCYHAVEHPEESDSHGFIGIDPHTLLTVLDELCDEIARNGFKKILLVSGHGGNTPLLEYFTRARFYKKRDNVVAWTFAYDFGSLLPSRLTGRIGRDPEYFDMLSAEDKRAIARWAKTGTGGGHADFRETALVLGTYPELVSPERYTDEKYGLTKKRVTLSDHEINCRLIEWFGNNPGCFGAFAPVGCSERIGLAVRKMSVDRLADIIGYFKEESASREVALEIGKM